MQRAVLRVGACVWGWWLLAARGLCVGFCSAADARLGPREQRAWREESESKSEEREGGATERGPLARWMGQSGGGVHACARWYFVAIVRVV